MTIATKSATERTCYLLTAHRFCTDKQIKVTNCRSKAAEMTAKRVPSKIVIAGNSKMSLNDRFSSIPRRRPKAGIMKPQQPRFGNNTRKVQAQYEEQIEYVPKAVIRRPRHMIQQRNVQFQSRVSFVNTVPVQRFTQRNNFVQRPQFQNNFRRQFRPNFNQQTPNRKFFQHNHNNNRFNHHAGGFQGRKPFPTAAKKKSLAELDRELEDYMRKPKHTPITI
uniref:FoP_duplication domain-containing protein n=1 Tax=Caenorhabditis tropicalis TaxID=1561998 RepID=A0A1I7UEM0_9PELO